MSAMSQWPSKTKEQRVCKRLMKKPDKKYRQHFLKVRNLQFDTHIQKDYKLKS